ncbi:MAG: hydroxymethylpyrimidine/phosphomethylpyrimidine kinase [Flavobacteriales bacterium]|nr:hydroxymethylpyrimidine/phosphomethylpyrimidine kinase [Flavobacteriales bacterium]
MSRKVLSIAGLDPSAGAGVLQDVKTLEAHHVDGFGVCTALTFQNEKDFEDVKWTSVEDIVRQIEVLFKTIQVSIVKIGLIENLNVLEQVVDYLLECNSNMKIIWDPILKASAGFTFHSELDRKQLEGVLTKIYLVTPNQNEKEAFMEFTDNNFILVKGQLENNVVVDLLYLENEVMEFKRAMLFNKDKHGTGCVFSATIAASLAKGLDLVEACESAQKYTAEFMNSTNTLLGTHIKHEVYV